MTGFFKRPFSPGVASLGRSKSLHPTYRDELAPLLAACRGMPALPVASAAPMAIVPERAGRLIDNAA